MDVENLDDMTLEAIAEIICGDGGPKYRKGWELPGFFERAGFGDMVHDGTTRKWWVRDRLKEICFGAYEPGAIKFVIERLANPKEYQGDREKLRHAVEMLNKALELEGLRVTVKGMSPVISKFEPDFTLGDSEEMEDQELGPSLDEYDHELEPPLDKYGGEDELSIRDPLDIMVLETLEKMCPTACASYKQGILDLSDQKRVSWRGTVTEFREALREILDILAPDDDVVKQEGFTFEKDGKTGKNRDKPTMKQKVVFIMKSRKVGKAALDTMKSHIDLVDEKTGAFVRSVYNRSSSSTHGTPDQPEAQSIMNYIALILAELLQVKR